MSYNGREIKEVCDSKFGWSETESFISCYTTYDAGDLFL